MSSSVYRECFSWEKMRPESRIAIAVAAGFDNQHQLRRIALSNWYDLPPDEAVKLWRVDWKQTLLARERGERYSA